MSPDERAIRELVDTWMTASRAGDTETVLSLMSDDVIFMVPGREPFGKQTFATNSRSMDGVKLEGSVKSPMMYAYSDSTSPTPATDGT